MGNIYQGRSVSNSTESTQPQNLASLVVLKYQMYCKEVLYPLYPKLNQLFLWRKVDLQVCFMGERSKKKINLPASTLADSKILFHAWKRNHQENQLNFFLSSRKNIGTYLPSPYLHLKMSDKQGCRKSFSKNAFRTFRM